MKPNYIVSLLRQWGTDASNINGGDCDKLVYALMERTPKCRGFWFATKNNAYFHCVALIGDKFYDAANPSGVKDSDDLEYFKKYLKKYPRSKIFLRSEILRS